MNKLQYVGYSAVASLMLATQSFAANGVTLFGGNKDTTKITGAGGTAESAVQGIIQNALTFIGILAVCYGIWGWFQIITAWGDEEKVKKGRTIIVQVLIGILVIFLANSIIKWFLSLIITA
jgi:hypothetical protein